MSDPIVQLNVSFLGGLHCADGTPEVCPVCGSAWPVIAVLDASNWSTEPAVLSCDRGHTWQARELEAWHLADVVLQARVQHPEFDEDAERLARQLAEDR